MYRSFQGVALLNLQPVYSGCKSFADCHGAYLPAQRAHGLSHPEQHREAMGMGKMERQKDDAEDERGRLMASLGGVKWS
jgi:hypothetical protein